MIERDMIVINKNGIHARPAALIVQITSGFDSRIEMRYNDNRVNAKSIMGIITLGAAKDSVVTVLADGDDETAVLEALEKLFLEKFEE